ncbi:MAG: transcriptional regulator [Betaproteobacteria bacterium]|nr:transcriptional regulator [Betaproteobacteria bacterium]
MPQAHRDKTFSLWAKILYPAIFIQLVGWYLGLFWIGADKDQGEVFRIMFVHVPVAWCAFVWILAAAVFAIIGFVRKSVFEQMDQNTHAAIDLGTVFGALALATGSIWGRPTWGVWWDWDPRLTTTLVMFLICCAYHVLRSFTPDVQARRNAGQIVAILAAVNVPIVYFSVNIWRSVHQPQTFVRKGGSASPDIGLVLLVNTLAMLLLSFVIFKIRRVAVATEETLEAAREGRNQA